MGGLIGMMLAAQPQSPIRRLVLNDVGAFIPKAALERIADYIGADPVFEDLAALEAYLRFIYMSFGTIPDHRWRAMAEASSRRLPDGRYGLAYDPAIARPLKQGPLADVDLWSVWNAVRCPVLIIRGMDSDLLLAEDARRMVASRPGVRLVEIPGAGHAPSLMNPDQIALITEFLNDQPSLA
jgi:pimeloyl-ACP methyl ester carboxylesterase